MEEQQNLDEHERKTPDLREIMEEEVACKKGSEKGKVVTPDDLATMLKRKKLEAIFPTINPIVLLEIFQAHNNSYEQTVEVLIASTDYKNIVHPQGQLMDPPITESVLNEMKLALEDCVKVFFKVISICVLN